MPKRLKALAAVLLALLGLSSLIFWKLGRETFFFPLKDINDSSVQIQIDQKNRQLHLILAKQGPSWKMAAPLSDLADAGYSGEILTSLRNLKIGSVLSSDPDSYADYDLTEQKAVHVQVRTSSGTVFDGYFGKPSAGPDELYFRFAGNKRVYLSEGLENYELTRSTDDYRERQLFSASLGDISQWTLILNGKTFQLSKSSGIWTTDLKSVGPADAASLANSFSTLRLAVIPDPGSITDKAAGVDAPALTVAASGPGGAQTWLLGKNQPPTAKGAKSYYRFVKSKERNLIATINAYDADPIFKILAPKK